MLRLFKAVSKGTVNHIVASEKNLDCQHEMEYHVIRLVVILHDCPVGKRVRSEQANEASAFRTLVCLSFRSLSIPSILVAIDIIVVSLERTDRSLTSTFFSDLL